MLSCCLIFLLTLANVYRYTRSILAAVTVAAEAITPCISLKEKVKKTEKSEFSKPKQLTASECFSLEVLRFMLQCEFGSSVYCMTQIDVSSKELEASKQERREGPMKIVKIEGVFVQPLARRTHSHPASFVAHVHIEKEPKRNKAVRLLSFSLSTEGCGEKDAHRTWIPRDDDSLGNFSDQLLREMRRPIMVIKKLKS